jgi:hypothetical protein
MQGWEPPAWLVFGTRGAMGVNPPAPQTWCGSKKTSRGLGTSGTSCYKSYLQYVTFLTFTRVSGYLNISELRPKCGCSQQNSSVKIRIDKTLSIQPTRQRSMSHIKIYQDPKVIMTV